MATVEISKSFTLGTKGCGGHVIRLSHNLIENAHLFDKATLNLLIAIVFHLRNNIILQPRNNYSFEEVILPIPAHIIHKRHVSDISESLNYLMDLKLVFSRSIPGYSVKGVTRMISGVTCENGKIMVTIPGDAIPWILYCGTQVGFAQIEAEVFLKLPSRTDKLLYLLLLSKTDNSSSRSSFNVGIKDLYKALDLKDSRSVSSILFKNLNPFDKVLKEAGSRYSVVVKPITDHHYSSSRGRKPVESIRFEITNTLRKDRGPTYEDAAAYLIGLMNKYGVKNIGVCELVQTIHAKGKEDEFASLMHRLSEHNLKKPNDHLLINTATKKLQEMIEISIKVE